MSVPPPWPQVLDFFAIPLVIEPSPGQLSSDAGLLPRWQPLDDAGAARLFAQVNAYNDAINARPIPKPRGRNSRMGE
jgi:hypothetical protein